MPIPLIKTVALVAVTFLIFSITNPMVLSILSVMLVFFLFFSDFRHKMGNRIKPLFFIFLLVVLFQLLFNFSVPVSQRIWQGITAGLKLFLMSMAVFIYSSCTSAIEIISVFSFLPKPLPMMMTITFSLLPVIASEADRIKAVQKTRGLGHNSHNPTSGIFPVIIPLLHRSLKRAEQIAMNLEVKGYGQQNMA